MSLMFSYLHKNQLHLQPEPDEALSPPHLRLIYFKKPRTNGCLKKTQVIVSTDLRIGLNKSKFILCTAFLSVRAAQHFVHLEK